MTDNEKIHKSPKGARRFDILKAMVSLLQQEGRKKITTKSLASHIGLSEAALYRHFASKAQMYDSLLESVESSLISLINQIEFSENSGLFQAESITASLMLLPNEQPGIVILLVGDFLANEDPRLQSRISLIFDKLKARIKQSLRTAQLQKEVTEDYDVELRSQVLLSTILGHWLMFCRSNLLPEQTQIFDEIKLILR